MSETIRVLIVDDEPLSRERIRGLLRGVEDVEVVGECSDGLEALAAIESTQPDLVFLDVQMPVLSGLAVVEALERERCPQVVFVTAYDTYMERAFEVHALDYLRKPYTDGRFFDALSHARRRIEERRGYEDLHTRILSILAGLRESAEGGAGHLAIREAERSLFRVIRTRDIDWLEAHEKQVRVHVGDRVYLLPRTLTEAAEMLDGRVFLRVHRSFIVNSDRIRTVESLWKGQYEIRLQDGTRIQTGRTYRAAVESFLGRS